MPPGPEFALEALLDEGRFRASKQGANPFVPVGL